jgi:hypothetical protein
MVEMIEQPMLSTNSRSQADQKICRSHSHHLSRLCFSRRISRLRFNRRISSLCFNCRNSSGMVLRIPF